MAKYTDFTNYDDFMAALTPEEAKRMEGIENKFDNLYAKWKKEETALQPPNPPMGWNEGELPDSPEVIREWDDYEKRGSKEWHEKREEWHTITQAYNKERNDLYNQIQERRFTEMIKELGVEQFFQSRIKTAEEAIKKAIEKNNKKGSPKIYTQYGLNRIIQSYEDVIKTSKDVLNKLDNIEDENIQKLSFSEILKLVDNDPLKIDNLLQIPNTRYPDTFITPKDKVSNKLFNGELSEELTYIATESRTSKKELTAKVNIGFDELDDVKINRNFSPYDREVHDAIVSLYIDGENEYMTPQMIYRTMTGNPGAKLNPRQFQAISDSIRKCSFTRIAIDATGEAKAYGMDKLTYEGNLIYAERVTGEHKGEVNEWIHILRKPVLYDYANSKQQVARMDIELLNTPINKNEEAIILQGYLQRRILAMKGSNLSKNIVYDTVYKYLNVSAASPGALRKKKSKIRDSVKEILNYWKENKFICDYKENKKGNSIVSVTIILD